VAAATTKRTRATRIRKRTIRSKTAWRRKVTRVKNKKERYIDRGLWRRKVRTVKNEKGKQKCILTGGRGGEKREQ